MNNLLLQKLIHYALLVVLMTAQWGRVLAVPIASQSRTLDEELERAVCQSNIVLHEASELLDIYVRIYDFTGESFHEDVPDATVTGGSTAETLHSIAATERLLSWHLGVVESDHNVFWGNPDDSLPNAIKKAKLRLHQHYSTVENLLKAWEPDFITPPTSATPHVNVGNGFDKKKYGWGVLAKLKELATNVKRELTKMNGDRSCPRSSPTGEDIAR